LVENKIKMGDQQHSEGLTWQVIPFGRLSPLQLHDLLKVRVDVFVVEQQCAYEEIDGKDPGCFHVLGMNSEGRVVATARIAPPGVLYTEASIGRVAMLKAFRGFGYGYDIMNQALTFSRSEFHESDVKIAAQYYLEKFYQQLGFVTISDQFPWDGIPHVYMLLTFRTNG
jgi:ElaA protein